MKKSRIYLGLLVLGTAFWGISFPLVKEGISIVHPFSFLMYRFLLAALVLSILFFKQLKQINWQTIKYGVWVGIPLLLAILLQTIGLQYTSSANASFISGMDVLLIPILKFCVFRKSIKPKTWLACTMALAGLYVIAMASAGSGFNRGDMYAVGGAIAFAAYVLMVGKYNNKVETILLVIVQLYTCTIVYAVLAFATVDFSHMALPMDWNVWKAVLFTGIFATAYMYGIQNVSQKYIEEEKVALTYLCEPVFATLAAYVLISEPITIRTIIGGGLILLSMFISEYRFKYIPFLRTADKVH
ncbi:DMT family transporter [Dysgonomonas sp. HGC4]|uniref:DMT family transporter n=1 Tax=Dysgonomonas sp. HGC4 TaxID=1658009 RepID=UPI000681CF27|nr:DMT family transporter [Dysgonomonas sp. HGC4]MBD8347235.1 DMT family transporter [Dysgonomonas sp. HGC4]